MMKAKPIGLYVHIPFCVKKCNYCDFCSYSDLTDDVRKRYIAKLKEEILKYSFLGKIPVDTVFFGGGTPSLLEPCEFYEICDAIENSFDILCGSEFTLEANPKTVSIDKMRAYCSRGVNRVSIGMQTIHENERKILGRIHNFEDFKNAYDIVTRSGITNIGIDVMYGIPEQTIDSFKKTLSTVVGFAPTHISAYGLILEENTNFWNIKETLALPSEDEECEMYNFACDFLASKGYLHYEISNYSKPGYESKHNVKYWEMQDFIGVGAAAYSCFRGSRFGNPGNIYEYISSDSEHYITEEVLDIESLKYEYVMLGLRMANGISLSEYQNRFGVDFLSAHKERLDFYLNHGFMKKTSDRISLTEKGFYVSNTILTDLL